LFELLKFSLFKFPEEYANEWFYQGEIKWLFENLISKNYILFVEMKKFNKPWRNILTLLMYTKNFMELIKNC
jgi:hypothetical protein